MTAVRITADFLDDPGSDPDTGCVDEIEPPDFTAADVDVEMTAFESEEAGLSGLRPEGWTEVVPGVFQESPLVSLIQQTIPGATADQVLQKLTAQQGAGQPPEPVDEISTESLTFSLYRVQDLGQQVDLGLGDTPGDVLLVQLSAPPSRSEVYREQVFLPAVGELAPLS